MGLKLRMPELGERFGHWVVLQPNALRKGVAGSLCSICRCDCGNEREIRTSRLLDGSTRSCGCSLKHPPEEERFWSRVRKTEEGCWLWTGLLLPNGYGRFCPNGAPYAAVAHRYAFEKMVGPIPDGQELHHTCEEKRCVNPAHLRAVTRWEHSILLTPHNPTAINAAKTHCIHGHEYSEENTYHDPKNPRWRSCRACRRERMHHFRLQHPNRKRR